MTNLRDLTYEELENLILDLGEKKFRAKQVYEWLMRGVNSYDEMLNVPSLLKTKLSENYFIHGLEIVKKLVSAIDNTKKYLFKLHDGNMVESVVMYYKHGITV